MADGHTDNSKLGLSESSGVFGKSDAWCYANETASE
jgi:hypothetical protein